VVGLPEPLHLLIAILPVHAAVNLGDLAGVAHAFQTADQIGQGVAVFSEDDELLVRPPLVREHGSKPIELGFGAGLFIDTFGQVEKVADLFPFGEQVRQRRRDDALQQTILANLVSLDALRRGFLVSRLGVERIPFVSEPLLERQQLLHGDPTLLHVGDQPVEFPETALEGSQQGVRRTGQAALEHAHGQPCGRTVQQLGSVVDETQVVGRLVIQALLAYLALRQFVAKRV